MGKYQAVPLEREDEYGSFRLMAVSEGYVMARRKGCTPVVMTIDEWVEIGRGHPQATPLRSVE